MCGNPALSGLRIPKRTHLQSNRQDQRTDFRLRFQSFESSAARALLYVTGQDTAGAWINGKQVLRSAAAASVEANAVENVRRRRTCTADGSRPGKTCWRSK